MTDGPKVSLQIREFTERLAAIYADHQLEMIARCSYLQDRETRKRRVRAVMDLSAERQRLLNEHGRHPARPDLPQGFQGSAFMEATIEHLIDGNAEEVRAEADLYLFEGEGDWAKEWIEVYAKFRAMAHAAVADPGSVQ